MRFGLSMTASLTLAAAASPAIAATRSYSAAQMFAIAEKAGAAHDDATAAAIYRALEHDPHVDLRNEARFRHAQLLERQKKLTDAAVLLHAILDETPKAQPARLELAKVLAMMGHEGAAQRELRAAQAAGLPPQVARIVNQFAAALHAARPLGASIELGLAPSSNINRATSDATLNSTIGPLIPSHDAQAQSGVGLNLGGQINARVPVSAALALTARLSSQNTLYHITEFNDSTFAGDAGVALALSRSRLRLTLGPSYRLYGAHPFTRSVNAMAGWNHPLGQRGQIDLESDYSSVRYQTNRLQTGDVFTETASVERAFSARFGARLSFFGQRATAANPGYATASGGGGALVWREWGKTTVYANGSVSHLESDARLNLFPDRRKEWLYRAGVGATFRQIAVAGFSPLVRLNWERNRSSVDLYDYHRLAADLAITRAF